MMVRDIASWLSINCNCKRSRLRHSCSITSTMIPVFLLSSLKNQKYDSNKIYKPHVLFKHYPSDGVILKKKFYIEQFTFREFCIYWLYVWNYNDVILTPFNILTLSKVRPHVLYIGNLEVCRFSSCFTYTWNSGIILFVVNDFDS